MGAQRRSFNVHHRRHINLRRCSQTMDSDGGEPELSADFILDDFFQKYPCDERAVNFLANSSETVVERAVSDFRPPREGEADYSAILMSFVKRLRSEATDSTVMAGDFDGFR